MDFYQQSDQQETSVAPDIQFRNLHDRYFCSGTPTPDELMDVASAYVQLAPTVSLESLSVMWEDAKKMIKPLSCYEEGKEEVKSIFAAIQERDPRIMGVKKGWHYVALTGTGGEGNSTRTVISEKSLNAIRQVRRRYPDFPMTFWTDDKHAFSQALQKDGVCLVPGEINIEDVKTLFREPWADISERDKTEIKSVFKRSLSGPNRNIPYAADLLKFILLKQRLSAVQDVDIGYNPTANEFSPIGQAIIEGDLLVDMYERLPDNVFSAPLGVNIFGRQYQNHYGEPLQRYSISPQILLASSPEIPTRVLQRIAAVHRWDPRDPIVQQTIALSDGFDHSNYRNLETSAHMGAERINENFSRYNLGERDAISPTWDLARHYDQGRDNSSSRRDYTHALGINQLPHAIEDMYGERCIADYAEYVSDLYDLAQSKQISAPYEGAWVRRPNDLRSASAARLQTISHPSTKPPTPQPIQR